MKTTTISSADIVKSRSWILEATPYCCPTRQVDLAIVRAEKNLENCKNRLERLKVEREQILKDPLSSTRNRIRILER